MVDKTNPDESVPAEVRHEPSDASLGWVLGFAASLVVLGGITLVTLWWLFLWLLQRPAPVRPPASVLATSQRGQLPPEPRLEGLVHVAPAAGTGPAPSRAPPEYGWVDRQTQVLRIPPEQAQKILLSANRFPSQPSPAGAHVFQREAAVPSAANSGRDLPGDLP
jgi:hypothetical protein